MAKKEEKKDFHVEMGKLVDQVKKNFHKLTNDAGKMAKQGEKAATGWISFTGWHHQERLNRTRCPSLGRRPRS